MARPLTYREPEYKDQARAGAAVLNRMEAQADDDARYQDQRAHQLKQESLAEERNARAEGREERMTKSQELDDEIRKWDFEKKKALDANAARMKIETDKQAIEANEALFKINTETDDAPLKLAEWGAKYFRVLDEKTGDPRLIRQFQINQGRADSARAARAKLEEERAKLTEAQKAGMIPSSVTAGGVTYTNPKAEKEKAEKPDTYDDFNKDLEAAKEAYKPTGGNLPPFIQKAFEERGRRLEEAVKNPTGAPASTPAASGPVATNPKTGQKLVLRDGKWQPL